MKPKRKLQEIRATLPRGQSPEVIWPTGGRITIADLEAGAKNPAEILGAINPPALRAVVQSLGAAVGLIEGGDAPDWAKRAAREGLKWMMPPDAKSDAYQVGWVCGLGSQLLPGLRRFTEDALNSERLFAFMQSLIQAMPLFFAQQPLIKAGEFFDGARAGERKGKEFDSMPHNPKCLLVIAMAWRQFVGSSMAQVHQRFLKWKLIAADADSRQTRILLSGISFPPGRQGRPRKRKPE